MKFWRCSSSNSTSKLGDEEKKIYTAAWAKSIEVQQHFNDISWRIRALWLTALTFTLGATFIAYKGSEPLGQWIFEGKSPALFIPTLGVFLWVAFWFVDAAWYHRLLVGAVIEGLRLEGLLKDAGIDLRLTSTIGNESPINTFLGEMHSKHKLNAFYVLGGLPLIATILVLALEHRG